MYQVGVIVPSLTDGGGVPAVARFLVQVLEDSPDFEARLFSVPVSSRDVASVRLRAPSTWLKGPRVVYGTWEGREYSQVGAVFAELEFQRYRPRNALNEQLRNCDLVQIVAGTPAWGLLTRDLDIPVALQVATLVASDRSEKLRKERDLVGYWRRAMTTVTARLDQKGAGLADRVLVENSWMEDRLSEWLPEERVVFAPPGIDTSFFRPHSNRSLDERGDYILSVGRFGDPRKNVGTLIEAYARLHSFLPSTPRLVLAGKSSPPNDVWRRAKELGVCSKITFHLGVSRDRLAELYRHATVFALSSVEEGLGVVLLEAMASGVPVVSTATEGAKEAIEDGRTGLLVPIGDPEALARGLESLLKDANRARIMGQRGRDRAVRRYSMKAAGERFLRTYRDLLT